MDPSAEAYRKGYRDGRHDSERRLQEQSMRFRAETDRMRAMIDSLIKSHVDVLNCSPKVPHIYVCAKCAKELDI